MEFEETSIASEQQTEVVDSGTPAQEIEQPQGDQKESFVWADEAKYETMALDEVKDVIRKKDEQLWHKELAYQRHTKEVEMARKRELEFAQKEQELANYRQMLAQQEDQIKDQFYDNPQAYNNHIYQTKLVEQQLQQVQAQKTAAYTEQVVKQFIPNMDELAKADESVDILKKDLMLQGIPEYQIAQYVDGWKQGNWRNVDPRWVVSIAERASLVMNNKALQQQVKSIVSSPDDVGKRIAQVANQSRNIPQSSYAVQRALTEGEISKMTPAQVKEELAKKRAMLAA